MCTSPWEGSEHSLKGRLRNKKWVCAQTNVPLMYIFVICKCKRRCILKECLRKRYSMSSPSLIEYVDSRFYVWNTSQILHVSRRIYCGLYSTYAKCDVWFALFTEILKTKLSWIVQEINYFRFLACSPIKHRKNVSRNTLYCGENHTDVVVKHARAHLCIFPRILHTCSNNWAKAIPSDKSEKRWWTRGFTPRLLIQFRNVFSSLVSSMSNISPSSHTKDGWELKRWHVKARFNFGLPWTMSFGRTKESQSSFLAFSRTFSALFVVSDSVIWGSSRFTVGGAIWFYWNIEKCKRDLQGKYV